MGGIGDCDLYLKYGSLAGFTDYDYKSVSATNEEEILVNNPQSGWWYILVYGYLSYSGLSLLADYDASSETGSLQVNIEPIEVVNVGAQWRVDGGAWQNSGATVSGLSVGDHTVEFKDILGWLKPGSETVRISADQTTTLTRSYTRQAGSLRVVIDPVEVVNVGAQWRVDGGAWQNSGVTVTGLSVGGHTVEYKEVSGWTEPEDMQVEIQKDQTTYVNGRYVEYIEEGACCSSSKKLGHGDKWYKYMLDFLLVGMLLAALSGMYKKKTLR